jgi:hypothetical protein
MNAEQVSGLSPEEVLVLETGHVMARVDWIAECGGTSWEVISMGQPVHRGREAITNPHRLLFGCWCTQIWFKSWLDSERKPTSAWRRTAYAKRFSGKPDLRSTAQDP